MVLAEGVAFALSVYQWFRSITIFYTLISYVPFYAATMLLSVASLLFELYLYHRQLEFLKGTPEASYTDVVEKFERRKKVFTMESLFGFTVEAAILHLGMLVWVWNFCGLIFTSANHPVLRGVLFIFSASVFATLVKMPFEMYQSSVMRKLDATASTDTDADADSGGGETATHGAKETVISYDPVTGEVTKTPVGGAHDTAAGVAEPPTAWQRLLLAVFGVRTIDRRWVLEQLQVFGVSVLFGGPVLAVLLSFLQWDRFEYQMVVVTFALCVVAFYFSDLYPSLFAPMFYKLRPLEDVVIIAKIQALCARLNLDVKRVVVVEGDKGSRHANAFFMGFGFGATDTIALYEGVVKKCTPDQVVAVVAHEIAHSVNGDVWKQSFTQFFLLGNFMYLFFTVIDMPEFYASFGFAEPDAAVGLLLFSYIYSSVGNLMRFASNVSFRRFEYTADEFALRNGCDIASALLAMFAGTVLVMPDHLFSRYFSAHPSVKERLERLELLAAQAGGDGEKAAVDKKED